MTQEITFALAQLNLLVGDIDGNVDKLIKAAERARDQLSADVIVFPELAITGYPAEDLWLREDFLSAADAGLLRLQQSLEDIYCIVGHTHRQDGCLYNAASVIGNSAIHGRYLKHILPNEAVFDEKRYFTAGNGACVVEIKGARVGVIVCEDVWHQGPTSESVAAGAQIVAIPNASPFRIEKAALREQDVVPGRARDNQVPIIYVNHICGQDELVFDGASFTVDAQGDVCQRMPAFEEGLATVGFRIENDVATPIPGKIAPHTSLEQTVYNAIVTGVRDYVNKNGFPGVVLGLSGGIDSALTLAIAVDALGAEKVEAVMMPSRYTSDMSLEDAKAEAEALNVNYHIIPIEKAFAAFQESLAERFAGLSADTTEENIQARCRGILLMAISNKSGKMVLTTGNKSEMAVGYATLYGDMVGGFAAIKDVPKTLVYRLAEYRNSISPMIPQRVLDRPPSAELAPDQRDDDSLPPYDILDPILEAFIEEDRAPDEIIAMGFAEETVQQVVKMVQRNEYKRRQAAPGVRITKKAFGRDRRYPITSGYRRG